MAGPDEPEEAGTPGQDEIIEHGWVTTTSARLLIVDPCHLPNDLLAELTRDEPDHPAPAVVVGVPLMDDSYEVLSDDMGLRILDPAWELSDPPSVGISHWTTLPDGQWHD